MTSAIAEHPHPKYEVMFRRPTRVRSGTSTAAAMSTGDEFISSGLYADYAERHVANLRKVFPAVPVERVMRDSDGGILNAEFQLPGVRVEIYGDNSILLVKGEESQVRNGHAEGSARRIAIENVVGVYEAGKHADIVGEDRDGSGVIYTIGTGKQGFRRRGAAHAIPELPPAKKFPENQF